MGLDRPRSVVWLPNGEMLLIEWTGKIRVLREGKVVTSIEGVAPVFLGAYNGLRDIKVAPDFSENHLILRVVQLCNVRHRQPEHGQIL